MADATLDKTLISLDQLLEMEGDTRYEIVDGELVEMAAAGVLHQIIISNLNRPIDSYVQQHQIGSVFVDGLIFLMHSDEAGLRESFIPDLSFVRNENIPADIDITKPFPGVPNLAVEVISPNDKAIDIQEKITVYLAKGTEEVWVAYPETGNQSLHQYRRGVSTVRIYQEADEVIDASAFFPGLDSLTVAAIFKLPNWAKQD